MKGLMTVAVCLALWGCQTTGTNAPPMPGDLHVVRINEKIPSKEQSFVGQWGPSAWDGKLEHVLVVERVEGNEATVVYSFGSMPEANITPNWFRVKGVIEGTTLTLPSFPNGARAGYRMNTDGSLAGTYDLNGRVSTVTLTKAPLVSFAAPEVGTKFELVNTKNLTKVFEVERIEGTTVHMKSVDGQSRWRAGWLYVPGARAEMPYENRVHELFPLETGKTVTAVYDNKNEKGNTAKFKQQFSVLRYETNRIGSRELPVYVIERRVSNETSGQLLYTQLHWYSQSYGLVRFQQTPQEDKRVTKDGWHLWEARSKSGELLFSAK